MYYNHLLGTAIGEELYEEGPFKGVRQSVDEVIDKLMSLCQAETLPSPLAPPQHTPDRSAAAPCNPVPISEDQMWEELTSKLDYFILRWCFLPVRAFFKAILRYNLDTKAIFLPDRWYAGEVKREYYKAQSMWDVYERYLSKEEMELLDEVAFLQRTLVDPFGFNIGSRYDDDIYYH